MNKIFYFDNAATSFPKPQEVAASIYEYIQKFAANPGRSSHKLSIESAKKVFETRENLAKIFNFENSEHFIFTANATESLNIVLNGYLNENDYILTTFLEHNSVLRPLNFLKKTKKININFIEFCPQNGIDFDDFYEKLKDKTPKLVIINHASNVTGKIVNLNKILDLKKEFKFKLLIDGAQTGGIYNYNLKEQDIDFLALTGHKGLYGPQGIGVLFIRNPEILNPLKFGGTGSLSEKDIQPEFLPDKFESGTLNVVGIVGLNEGLNFIDKIRISKIAEKKEKLTGFFIENLKDINEIKIYSDTKNNSGVVSINIEKISPSKISQILDKNFNIATRPGLHCAPVIHKKLGTFPYGTVRFSFSFFNEIDELEYAINALNYITKNNKN